jgi:hypothetical protein
MLIYLYKDRQYQSAGLEILILSLKCYCLWKVVREWLRLDADVVVSGGPDFISEESADMVIVTEYPWRSLATVLMKAGHTR